MQKFLYKMSKSKTFNRTRSWMLGFFALGFFLLPFSVKATHIVGGDISYECLGNNLYAVTLNVYRDCFYGDPLAWFDDPAYVGVYKADGSLFKEIQMDFDPILNDTLSNELTDPCLFIPPDVCVHTTRYRETVSLPFSPGGYTLIYQRCCRNQTIVNISNPLNTGASYTIDISEEALTLCNSSPEFGQLNQIYICTNKPFIEDYSAVDPDGDSLAYRLCRPVSGGAIDDPQPIPPMTIPQLDSVDYIAPFYSVENMLGGDIQPLEIDPVTGLLTAFPEITGQFVVGICVEEYRDGQLLSTVRRDFQYNAGPCGEFVSAFFSPSSQCEDLEVSFTNESLLAEEYLWYFDSANDLGLTSSDENPVFNFPDTGYYEVMLIAQPNSVCRDTFVKCIYLQDNTLTVDFTTDLFVCDDTYVLSLMDESVDEVFFDSVNCVVNYDVVLPPVEWLWEIDVDGTPFTSTEQHPVLEVPQASLITVTLTATSNGGCVRTLTQSISTDTITPQQTLIEATYEICAGESVFLNPNVDDVGDYPYFWTPNDDIPDPTEPNPEVSPDQSTLYQAILYAPDSICFIQSDVQVNVSELPILDFDFSVGCDGLTVQFQNNSENNTNYQWDFGVTGTNTDVSTDFSPSFTYPDLGTYTVTLASADTELCQDAITVDITLTEKILDAAFTYDISDCDNDFVTIQFNNESINNLNNTDSFEWLFSGGNGSSTDVNPTLTVNSDQTIQVQLTIITAEGCTDIVTEVIEIDITEVQIASDIQICLLESNELNPGGDPAYEYNWSPTTGLDDPTSPNPIANPSETTTYTVTITNVSFDTCVLVQEITVFVPDAMNLSATEDFTSCEPFADLTATFAGNSTTIAWTGPNGEDLGGDQVIEVPLSGEDTYTVIATDQFGCQEFDTVNVAGGPVDMVTTPDLEVCLGEPINIEATNQDPNDILSYSWTPTNIIASGASTANPQIIEEPGIYTLTVSALSQYGCTDEQDVNVVIIDDEVTLAFDYLVSCEDGLTVDFTNLSTNAFGYIWDFGVPGIDTDTSTLANPTYVYDDFGDYTVTLNLVFDADCVVPPSETIEIIPPVLIPDFSYTFGPCEEGEIEIQFEDESQNFQDNTVFWEWQLSDGQTLMGPSPTATIDMSQELTVTLTITTANGCEATFTDAFDVDVVVIPGPTSNFVCPGGCINLNPQGNPDFTYEWTPIATLDDPLSPNPLACPDVTTQYSVTVTDTESGCVVSKFVTIEVGPDLGVSAQDTTVACDSGPVEIVASSFDPASTYVWFDADGMQIGTGPSIIVDADASTFVFVEAMNSFECTGMDTAYIVVPDEPWVIQTDFDIVSCEEEITLLAGTNFPANYVWYDDTTGLPIGVGQTIDITVPFGFSDTITLQAIHSDYSECQFFEDIIVSVPGLPDLTITGDDVACDGTANLTVVSDLPVDEFIWFNEDNEQIGLGSFLTVNRDPDSVGVYTQIFRVQGLYNGSECSVSAQFEVTFPIPLTIVALDDFDVCQDSVLLTATSIVDDEGAYAWCIGDDIIGIGSTLWVAPTETTIYTVKVVDAFGCAAADDVIATVPPPLMIDAIPDTTVTCDGPVDITATSLSGLDVTWVELPSGTIIGNGSTISILPDSVGTYEIILADPQFDCDVRDTFTIVNGIIDVQFDPDLVICPEDTASLNVVNLDAQDNLSITWTAGAGGEIIGSNTVFEPVITIVPPATEAVFTFFIDNEGLCDLEETITVSTFGFVPVVQDSVQICSDVPTPINPNGNANYDYLWDPSTGLDDPTLANPTATLEGPTSVIYSVTISNTFSGITCENIEQVVVEVNPPLELDAVGDTTVCEFPIATELEATFGSDVNIADLTWFDDPGLNNSIGSGATITVEAEGTANYYVLGVDELGCLDTAQIQINTFPIDASVEPFFNICLESFGQLEVINNASDQELEYLWSPADVLDDPTSATPNANPEETTQFEVVVTNQFGCTETLSTQANVIDLQLNLDATADPEEITLFTENDFSILSTNNTVQVDYLWEPAESLDDPTSPSPTATPEETTTYTVIITDVNGCVGMDTVTVRVLNPPCIDPFIFIPTGFTPNNDGFNDVLFIRSGDVIEELYFTIYNRWGQMLFETTDPSVGWDGTFQGELLSPDVYGYYLQVKCVNGEEFFKKGNITLLR